MVTLTIRLTPPLTGIAGDLYYIYDENYYYLMPLGETSTNGLIEVTLTTSAPQMEYAVIFPEQTVEDTTIYETGTPRFNLTSNVTLNITLKTEAPPTPPPPPSPPIKMKIPYMALPPLIAGAVLVYVFGR